MGNTDQIFEKMAGREGLSRDQWNPDKTLPSECTYTEDRTQCYAYVVNLRKHKSVHPLVLLVIFRPIMTLNCTKHTISSLVLALVLVLT